MSASPNGMAGPSGKFTSAIFAACPGKWSHTVDINHEPVRVKRAIEKLKGADPDISMSAIARALGIAKTTLFDIVKKAETIPPSLLVFSQDNPDFAPVYMQHMHLAKDELFATFYSLTHMGVVGILLAKAADSCRVVVIVDRTQALSSFELPRIRELLAGHVEVFTQKVKHKVEHQKMVIADDVVCSTGSANPSMKGLHDSFENLTYHFLADEIAKARAAFARQVDHDCERVTTEWLDAEEARLTAEHQAALAHASEGLTAEELAALDSFASEEGASLVAFDRDARLHASNRKSARKRYAARKEEGQCVSCSAALEPTDARVQCGACLEKSRVKRLQRKDQRVCIQCGRSKSAKHSKCARCLKQFRTWQRNRKAGLHVAGFCTVCLTKPCEENKATGKPYKHCADCRAREVAAHRRYKQKKSKPGKCSVCCERDCVKKPGGGLYKLCRRCRDRPKEARSKFPPHLCNRCGKRERGVKPAPQVGLFKSCDVCRLRHLGKTKEKEKPGMCITCHVEPREVKSGTSLYVRCKGCRAANVRAKRAYTARNLRAKKAAKSEEEPGFVISL